jgi:hypothetical protein
MNGTAAAAAHQQAPDIDHEYLAGARQPCEGHPRHYCISARSRSCHLDAEAPKEGDHKGRPYRGRHGVGAPLVGALFEPSPFVSV